MSFIDNLVEFNKMMLTKVKIGINSSLFPGSMESDLHNKKHQISQIRFCTNYKYTRSILTIV